MVGKEDATLFGFVAAVVVSTYYGTDKNKWLALVGGVAGYATFKTLFPSQPAKVEKRAPTPPPPVVEAPKPTDPVRRKVVVFDFDKCLMTRHWWGTHRTSPIAGINPKLSDFANSSIDLIIKDLLELNDSKDNNLTVHVAVASFGRGDVIAKAIQSILPPHLAQRVFITTPSDYDNYSDGQSMGSKNTQLKAISAKFDTAIADIIFFDDDRQNILSANQMGVNAVVAAPFTRDLEHKIYDHLEAVSEK